MYRVFASLVFAVTILAAGAAAAAQPGKTEILWLGQAAVRITTPTGKVILIDPWLTTNPKTPAGYKNLDAVGKPDIILVTHGHGDHFGDTVGLVKKYNVPMWGPAGMNQMLQTLGVLTAEQAPRMNKSGTITPFPNVNIRITQVHAEHSSELLLPDAQGKNQTYSGGEPIGFIIQLENGFKIYHMGDTGLFGDMALIGRYYQPDLLLIPIGGHFVMDPRDAAYATREFLKPKFAIPVHYGTIPQLRGTPEEYIQALGATPTKVITMSPGDQVSF